MSYIMRGKVRVESCLKVFREQIQRKHIRHNHLIRLLARRKLEMCAMFVIWHLGHRNFSPEIRCEEGIRFSDLVNKCDS
jgi:hypothetical protein